jgi:hypothetical protein
MTTARADRPTIHRNVRRLQVRIVQATKASRWGKVQTLQRLLVARNRVSPKEAFEVLELCERKLSCTVLRGLDGSNPVRLLGYTPRTSRPVALKKGSSD